METTPDFSLYNISAKVPKPIDFVFVLSPKELPDSSPSENQKKNVVGYVTRKNFRVFEMTDFILFTRSRKGNMFSRQTFYVHFQSPTQDLQFY